MSPTRAIMSRTIGMARNYYSTALSLGAFFAVSAMLFCANVDIGEGGTLSLGEIWTMSLSPVLPALAAILSMDVWSDERLSGRMDMLLTLPVKEMELVLGKYLGVLTLVWGAILTSWLSIWGLGLFIGHNLSFPILGMTALFMQGALWTAVGTMMSARFRHAAAAAMACLMVTVIIPRALWFGMILWVPDERMPYGMMPFDAHVLDMASGVVSTGMLFGYAILTVLALLITLKYVEMMRLEGYAARVLRRGERTVIFMSLVVAALTITLAMRLDVTLELPVKEAKEFSARTQSILKGAEGEVELTGFVSRGNKRFKPVVQMLRALKREAEMTGGLSVKLKFVDPKWDLGEAGRLVRMGAKEGSIVVRRGRRLVSVPLESGTGERDVASAILQVVAPTQRKVVYWTVGHGEAAFAQYDTWGMSDIARELMRDGYINRSLTLNAGEEIPDDCALILVAGAKTEFSRSELARIEAYLLGGGRMLALVENADNSGVNSILPQWGMKVAATPKLTGARTLSGTDVIVDDFGEHSISSPLKGTQLVFDRPVSLQPSAATVSGSGADKVEYSMLAGVLDQSLAAIGERGAGAGSDLALRPTRVAAVGDAQFVMNGQLAARQNANRDFFLNIVAYLSGVDAVVMSGTEAGVLTLVYDREERIRIAVILVGVVPFTLFMLMVLNAVRRRHRT